MQTTIWPTAPGGPIEREVGVSWLELGVSFSMYLQSALPILRTNSDGCVRLLFVQDQNDISEYSVTCTDVAATMQKMWCQAEGWIDVQAKPAYQKGLNMSLYSQGFGQATSGLTPRPWFWAQDRVVDFLQPLLAGRKAYDVAFKPDWCERRTGLLKNQNWKHISDTLKVVRRTWKGKGVH
jgi:hypothetical protein